MKNLPTSYIAAVLKHSLDGAASSRIAAELFRSRSNEFHARFAERCAARNDQQAARARKELARRELATSNA